MDKIIKQLTLLIADYLTTMGVLDGPSGTSADVPGVGRKMVSVSFRDERCRWERGIKEKLKEITKNNRLCKIPRKEYWPCIHVTKEVRY